MIIYNISAEYAALIIISAILLSFSRLHDTESPEYRFIKTMYGVALLNGIVTIAAIVSGAPGEGALHLTVAYVSNILYFACIPAISLCFLIYAKLVTVIKFNPHHYRKELMPVFLPYERDTDGRIRPFAVYGGGDLGDFSLALGEGIAGRVIERRKEMIVEDCTSDPRWQGKADAKTGFVTKSMIAVPLDTKEYSFGCIQIINKRSGDFYDNADLLFVKQLANFSAEMFERLGFVSAAAGGTAPENLSFAALCTARDTQEMEILLRSTKEFADLGVKDQQLVRSNMYEIHQVFARNKKRGR